MYGTSRNERKQIWEVAMKMILMVLPLLFAFAVQAEVIDEHTPLDQSRLLTHSDGDAEFTYEPTENYSMLKIGGFTVLVSGDALHE